MNKEESAATSLSRVNTWKFIRETLNGQDSPMEKLSKCLSAGYVHCAMTGDDSIVPPAVRLRNEEQVSRLDAEIKIARQTQTDNQNGQQRML